MAKGAFVRTVTGLMPTDETARDCLKGVRIGALVQVEVTRPRNLQMMRLYWALCRAIADSIGAETDNISDVLKVKTGHCTIVKTKTETLKFPRSISFAKMDQAAFDAFFNKCITVISTEWLGNMPDAEVKAQLEEMMGINHYAANPRSHKRSAA